MATTEVQQESAPTGRRSERNELHADGLRLDAGAVAFTLKNYGVYAAELLGASVVINAVALAIPVFTMVVYNKVIGNRVHETLWALAIGVGLLCSVELVLRVVRAYFVEHVSTRWDHLFDQRVLGASVRVPLEKLPDVGVLMHRYRDTLSARDFLSSNYVLGLADIPFLPLYFILLAVIGSWVAAVPLVAGGLVYLWIVLCHKVSTAYYKAALVPGARKIELLSQSVMASEVLRLMPGAGALARRLRHASADYSLLMARSRFWSALGSTGIGLLMSVSAVSTIVVGVHLVEAQLMSMGALIASSTLVARALAVVHSIATASLRFGDFKEALTRLEGDLPGSTEAQAGIAQDIAPRAQTGAAPVLQLEQISYRYLEQGRDVLRGVNLQIQAGERVAIVGRAGSGKSTLLRVLAGLVLPTDGHFLADSTRITELNLDRLRTQVGLKPQDAQLMDGTVLANVANAEDARSEQLASQLLRDVGLAAALQSGELALNTPVGEQGRRLSGGQRQLIAFARAIYQMRPILILDEPTLGLDQMSQAAVMRAIANLPRNVTVIIATHSAELMQLLDRVVAIDGGRKVADGPRDAVLVMSNSSRPATAMASAN